MSAEQLLHDLSLLIFFIALLSYSSRIMLCVSVNTIDSNRVLFTFQTVYVEKDPSPCNNFI